MKTKICKECGTEFKLNRNNRSNIFCSRSCSSKHNNKLRQPTSNETKNLISNSLKNYYLNFPEKIRKGEKQSKLVGNSLKGKRRIPKTIMDLSARTVTKILKRLNVGCSRCGWKESTCDIHHINGNKIPDADNHNNLTILCPNCHRLVHTHKIKTEDLIPLSTQLNEDWLTVYYG